MWPALVDYLLKAAGRAGRGKWGIAQKQTGADRLTIGGALAANVHGRGLKMKPFIDDVESFVLVDARGNARTCSRTENAELFRLAIGGYGLFGAISTVKLRLDPAPENSARRRGPDDRRPAEGLRAAHRRRVHVRRLPVLGR